ncbi:ABC transporter substrate-binding protein [Thioalkalicoccus limnaeus]|uniref:ABC transporter substrate-binding protein n=1 Tax=Thioalkalicoccus limnaeus TaxID=120681 RepID=A0ABV4BI51_9GAMM
MNRSMSRAPARDRAGPANPAACAVRGRLGVVLVLVSLLIGACTAPDPEPVDAPLRLALISPPRNLDPRLATDAASERVNRLLYRRLIEFDERSLPVPSLASWEALTPTHYRFTLGEEGRVFSDGTRLTAADVVATYRSILDPASLSPHRATLSLIASVQSEAPEQIDFHLDAPDPLFPAYLGIGILPAARIEAGHGFARAPIGSGPFRLIDWPEPARLRLERRRDGQPFELIGVRDPNVRVMKLLRGEVDMLQNDLSPELIGYLRRRDEVRVERRDGVNYSYLGFNLEDPSTGRNEVRQAIAAAIDRDAILAYLFQGGARPAAGLFPPTHWAGADFEVPPHDPAGAQAWLARIGHGPENPLRLIYKTSSDPFRLRLAAVIQAQLAAVGIDLEIRSYDWGTFFGDVQAGRFQLYGLTWVGLRTPDIFRYAFHSAATPPDGANRGRYRNDQVDRLIDTARQEPDLEIQAELYRQVQRQILRDLPYIPLWYEDQVFVARREVEGYRLAADGNYDGLERVARTAPIAARTIASRD